MVTKGFAKAKEDLLIEINDVTNEKSRDRYYVKTFDKAVQ